MKLSDFQRNDIRFIDGQEILFPGRSKSSPTDHTCREPLPAANFLRFLFLSLICFGLAACSQAALPTGGPQQNTADSTAALAFKAPKEEQTTAASLTNPLAGENMITAENNGPTASPTTEEAVGGQADRTTLPAVSAPPKVTAGSLPSEVQIEILGSSGAVGRPAVPIQNPLFGELLLIDELAADTPFTISWTAGNFQSAAIRHLNPDGEIDVWTAVADPQASDFIVTQGPSAADPHLNRYQVRLRSGNFFAHDDQFEELVTLEIRDDDGRSRVAQILFSRHDYMPGYTGPMTLAQPAHDAFRLGIDWRSERYEPQGKYAAWLNDQPELWSRVFIAVPGRDSLTWAEINKDKERLHQEISAAAAGDPLRFYYRMADGQDQLLGEIAVPYYTKFEIIHSPLAEEQFYTIRAGRDPGVTAEMLGEMGAIVRHMFSQKPAYLGQLAAIGAVHSVAPGDDLRALPEVGDLDDDFIHKLLDESPYGEVTGLTLIDYQEEVSMSTAAAFEDESPIKGMTLMHELVHQMQFAVYEPAWNEEMAGYYQDYMDLTAVKHLPNVAYFESTKLEWDAFITSLWFAADSEFFADLAPYLDQPIDDQGRSISDYLQAHWGDPLPSLK